MILSIGGICLSACWDASPPPWTRQTPPNQADPPGTRQTPGTRDPPHKRGRPPPLDKADTPPDQADPPRDQRPPGPGRPPLGSRRQHTVNERPVRILLECILVYCTFIIFDKMPPKPRENSNLIVIHLWKKLCTMLLCPAVTQPLST